MGYIGDADLGEPFQPFVTLREHLGFIPCVFQTQMLAPALVQAEVALLETLLFKDGALSRIQKECILLALAAANKNKYCAAWHYQNLRLLGIPDDKLDQILEDYRAAGLQPANVTLLDFVLTIGAARPPAAVEDMAALRAAGLAARGILEAVQITALG